MRLCSVCKTAKGYLRCTRCPTVYCHKCDDPKHRGCVSYPEDKCIAANTEALESWYSCAICHEPHKVIGQNYTGCRYPQNPKYPDVLHCGQTVCEKCTPEHINYHEAQAFRAAIRTE